MCLVRGWGQAGEGEGQNNRARLEKLRASS